MAKWVLYGALPVPGRHLREFLFQFLSRNLGLQVGTRGRSVSWVIAPKHAEDHARSPAAAELVCVRVWDPLVPNI